MQQRQRIVSAGAMALVAVLLAATGCGGDDGAGAAAAGGAAAGDASGSSGSSRDADAAAACSVLDQAAVDELVGASLDGSVFVAAPSGVRDGLDCIWREPPPHNGSLVFIERSPEICALMGVIDDGEPVAVEGQPDAFESLDKVYFTLHDDDCVSVGVVGDVLDETVAVAGYVGAQMR